MIVENKSERKRKKKEKERERKKKKEKERGRKKDIEGEKEGKIETAESSSGDRWSCVVPRDPAWSLAWSSTCGPNDQFYKCPSTRFVVMVVVVMVVVDMVAVVMVVVMVVVVMVFVKDSWLTVVVVVLVAFDDLVATSAWKNNCFCSFKHLQPQQQQQQQQQQ